MFAAILSASVSIHSFVVRKSVEGLVNLMIGVNDGVPRCISKMLLYTIAVILNSVEIDRVTTFWHCATFALIVMILCTN